MTDKVRQLVGIVKSWAHDSKEDEEGNFRIQCRVCKADIWPEDEEHSEWCLVAVVEDYAGLEAGG